MDLMLHFDGEERLEANVLEREKLAALDELAESVRTYVEVHTDAAEPRFDRLWTRIERSIEASGPVEVEAAPRTIEAAAIRADANEQTAGVLERFKRWLGEHRGYVFTSAITAAAVALLMLAIRPTEKREKIVRVPGETKIVKVPVEKIVRVPAPQNSIVVSGPAAVDSLDVTEGTTGAVLRIPGEDGDTTTVIWLSPEEDPI